MKSKTRSCFRGLSFILVDQFSPHASYFALHFLSLSFSFFLFSPVCHLLISPCVFKPVFFPSVSVSRPHSSFPLVSPASPAFFVLQSCFAPSVPSAFPVLHWFVLFFFCFYIFLFNSWFRPPPASSVLPPSLSTAFPNSPVCVFRSPPFLSKLAFCSFTCLSLSVFDELQHSCNVLMCSLNWIITMNCIQTRTLLWHVDHLQASHWIETQ